MDAARLPVEQRLREAIRSLEPKYRSLLQALVRIPSPIGQEAQAQAAVAAAMKDIGLEVDVFEIDRDRPCVVGTVRGSGGGRSMALNAHIDTAPVDPGGTWTHAPFSGDIDGTLLYGRGSWDDKAGVVETLLVVEALKQAGVSLRGDLVIKTVPDDESTGNGTLACLARGHKTDAAIIVDGTWPERFIVTHMGQQWFTIALEGRSAPASVRSRGANPIEAIGSIVRACRELVDQRNAAAQPWGANTSPVFINLGHVAAGAWEGAVPASGVIRGQFGFVPPDTPATAQAALVDAINRASQTPDWPAGVRATVAFGGVETPVVVGDAHNAVVKMITDTVSRLQGKAIQENIISGHCDLRHYYAAGIPACLYGPGGGKNAHSEDEYFDLTHLPLVAGNLASVVLEWCG